VGDNLHTLLTIGDVAERTGARVGTLREWERRHGFPDPVRLPSGHRRYTEHHVTQIRDVLRRQRSGSSLPAAIAHARARQSSSGSLFAAVAAASPQPPQRVSRRAMLALSRSIEDASASAGGPQQVVGSFQRRRVYDGCSTRWHELARGADLALAFADFEQVRRLDGLIEVPLATASPLHREWAVVAAGDSFAACLVGWQWSLGQPGFEAIWSVDGTVVATALQRAIDLAREWDPALELPDSVTVDVAHRSAEAVLSRVVGHLDAV
jgi:MerR family transcriptional regulator, light-induced transcriptional regulator